MGEDSTGQVLRASDGSTAATLPVVEDDVIIAATSTSSEFNTFRVRLIPLACFKLEDSNFEFDSSFMTILTFNAGPLKDLVDKHRGAKLSVFGHADPSGRDDYNKMLSGRRAQATFGLLVRDVKLWEDLYFHHDKFTGQDEWGVRAIQLMLNQVGPSKPGNIVGELDDQTRQALKDFETRQGLVPKGFDGRREVALPTFQRLATLYMDAICTDDANKDFRLTRDDFLARGNGKDGKGDIQGCSEFNPLLLFGQADKARLDRKENHPERDSGNQPNRRVMILLFRPGSQIDPAKWPCPTVKEGVAGCKKRFFSDGEKRRQNTRDEREFSRTKDTFACRFYDRLSNTSPCESIIALGLGQFSAISVASVPGEADDRPPSNTEVFDGVSPRTDPLPSKTRRG